MKNNRGGVLIVALVLSLCITMISICAINIAVLQLKMTHGFAQYIKKRLAAEQKLLTFEKQLAVDPNLINSEIQFLQFVPDSLLFDDQEGNLYYFIQTSKESDESLTISTTFGVRKSVVPSELKLIFADEQNKEWPFEQALSQPINVQLPSGESVVVIAGKARENVYPSLFFLMQETGELYKKVSLEDWDSDIIPMKIIIVPVDAKGQGYCDRLYVAIGSQLSKIDLNQSSWRVTNFITLENLSFIKDVAVGQHPWGEDVLIYLLGENKNAQEMIFAIEDTPTQKQAIYFTHPIPSAIALKLYQQYLLVMAKDKVHVLETFTGKKLVEKSWDGSEEIAEPPEKIINFLPKPAERKWELIYWHEEKLKKVAIKIKDKQLGRQTWWEK